MKNSCLTFIAFIPFCIAAFTSCMVYEAAEATIFVDNYSGRDVSILFEDEEWIRLNHGTSTQASLPPGPYTFLQYDVIGDVLIDELKVNLLADRKYVMNVLGGATYLSDKTVVVPDDVTDLDDLLGGGERIDERFFEAVQDYVLQFPPDSRGFIQKGEEEKTYLYRIPTEETKTYQVTDNDYWRREVNGAKVELITEDKKDQLYDIIREDMLCESTQKIKELLENDFPQLDIKCADMERMKESASLDKWDIEENRLIHMILGTIPSGMLSADEKDLLTSLLNENDMEGYFAALDRMDPQVNDLVALQARYHRLQQVRADKGDTEYTRISENKIKMAAKYLMEGL